VEAVKPDVRESHADACLVRLIEADPAVTALFFTAAFGTTPPLFDRATTKRQVAHVGARGSADILVHLFRGSAVVAAILVENKIDAGFTPDQPTRYAACREALRRANPSVPVATLLTCPAKYLAGSRLAANFDGRLSYEALRIYASGEDGDLLDRAIERAESPYEAVPVHEVMDFFAGYALILKARGADLALKSNPNSAGARPEASRTIYFDTAASGFHRYGFLLKEGRPADIRVSHQCWDSATPSASVKLMVGGWAQHIGVVAPILRSALAGSGLYLRPAGRSLALVADTPRLDNLRPAEPQAAAIGIGINRLVEIRAMWNGLRSNLAEAAEVLGKQVAPGID
jgi:hypothetical protein